jgi:hypothetical protein
MEVGLEYVGGKLNDERRTSTGPSEYFVFQVW